MNIHDFTAGLAGQIAASDAPFKKKGGQSEDARQKGNTMLNVVEEAPRIGNMARSEKGQFVSLSEHKRIGIWIDGLVEKAKETGKPVAQVVKLTPVMAEVLLGRNDKNRKVKTGKVDDYAHEMKHGQWAFNGEPIIISDTGELNDGQHRCMGVVQAQATIDAILIFGIARETRVTLDQGVMRTVGDYLSMEGHSYANVLGAAANYIWCYRVRGMLGNGSSNRRAIRATKSEVMQTVEANPGIERSVTLVHAKGADAVGGKSILAFAHFMFSTVSREDADHFILTLISGAGLKAGDPILYVRNRMINERGKLRPNDKAELIIKAWRAWRNRERVTRLLLSGGTLPPVQD